VTGAELIGAELTGPAATGPAATGPAATQARRLLASAAVLWLAACSSSTDVIGVLDPSVTELDPSVAELAVPDETANDGARPLPGAVEDADEALLVAGLALPDWSGPTSPWPLDTRLSEFFSESRWAARAGSNSGPGRAERAPFELRGAFPGEELRQVRYAAPTGPAAESLRDWFADAPDGPSPRDAERSLVARDSWGEQYLVALGDERCDRSVRRGGACVALNGLPSGRE
jgi:hypothetical protein